MENNNNKRNGRKTVRQVKPVGVWLCPLPLRIIVTSSHPGRRRDQKFLFASAFLIFQHAQGKPEKKRLTCRFASGLGGWAGLLVWGRAGGGTNNNFRRLWNNLCTYDNVSWRILRAILDDIYWAIVCPSLTQKTNKQQTSSIHPPPSPCGFDKAADESGPVGLGGWRCSVTPQTHDGRNRQTHDDDTIDHEAAAPAIPKFSSSPQQLWVVVSVAGPPIWLPFAAFLPITTSSSPRPSHKWRNFDLVSTNPKRSIRFCIRGVTRINSIDAKELARSGNFFRFGSSTFHRC